MSINVHVYHTQDEAVLMIDADEEAWYYFLLPSSFEFDVGKLDTRPRFRIPYSERNIIKIISRLIECQQIIMLL